MCRASNLTTRTVEQSIILITNLSGTALLSAWSDQLQRSTKTLRSTSMHLKQSMTGIFSSSSGTVMSWVPKSDASPMKCSAWLLNWIKPVEFDAAAIKMGEKCLGE
jgi:hypothetical protein